MKVPAELEFLGSNSLIENITHQLDALPVSQRSASALRMASHLVEYAAYEIARSDSAHSVAQLILIAADFDRRAQELMKR